MIRTIVVLLTVSMLASCAVKPAKTVPVDYKYDENVKIGFVSLISERPTHSHAGITAFNNFTKDLDVPGFSELAKEQFKLVNKSQLNSEASRRDGQLVYVRIGSVEIDGDVAHIRIGTSINIWPEKKVGLMCCCIGDMVLDRSVGGWVFREWGPVFCG